MTALAARCELGGGARQHFRFNNCGEGGALTCFVTPYARARGAALMLALAARRELGGDVRQHSGSTTAVRGSTACALSGFSGWNFRRAVSVFLYPLAMVAAESGARRSDYGGSSRRWVRAAGAGGISCRVASAIGGTIGPR